MKIQKTLGIMVVLLLLSSVTAFAQVSDTAMLYLSGIISPSVSVSVSADGAATNLPVDSVPSTPIFVGTITETSNTAYTLTVDSANDFVLLGDDTDTTTITYKLYYGGNQVTADGQISSGSSVSSQKDLEVHWDSAAPDGINADTTFSDTLTFTITSQ